MKNFLKIIGLILLMPVSMFIAYVLFFIIIIFLPYWIFNRLPSEASLVENFKNNQAVFESVKNEISTNCNEEKIKEVENNFSSQIENIFQRDECNKIYFETKAKSYALDIHIESVGYVYAKNGVQSTCYAPSEKENKELAELQTIDYPPSECRQDGTYELYYPLGNNWYAYHKMFP